ncbi:MAG: RibD family protein, partial [Anaerobutyricum sp.]
YYALLRLNVTWFVPEQHLDGKIACYTGDSKWVTGEESRAHVQTLRNHYKGIMAGIGTVLADDSDAQLPYRRRKRPDSYYC